MSSSFKAFASRAVLIIPIVAAVLGGSAISGCARPTATSPYVRTLEVKGVRNVSKHELENGLASRPLHFWERGSQRPFNEQELDRDRTRIQRFYEMNGYYATKVVDMKGTPRPPGFGVDVAIAVEEGPPTRIGDVKVFGIDGLDKVTRRRIQQYQLGIRRGQVFHHAYYLHFKESLTRELKKRGYTDAKVEGVVDVIPAQNLANITVTFHPNGVAAEQQTPSPTASTTPGPVDPPSSPTKEVSAPAGAH